MRGGAKKKRRIKSFKKKEGDKQNLILRFQKEDYEIWAVDFFKVGKVKEER